MKLLRDLEKGQGQAGDIEMLDKLAADCGPGLTFCALAPGAAMPLETALQHFRQEFEQGIGKVSGDTRGDPDWVAASTPASSR